MVRIRYHDFERIAKNRERLGKLDAVLGRILRGLCLIPLELHR
jgi:hypothetical protein